MDWASDVSIVAFETHSEAKHNLLRIQPFLVLCLTLNFSVTIANNCYIFAPTCHTAMPRNVTTQKCRILAVFSLLRVQRKGLSVPILDRSM